MKIQFLGAAQTVTGSCHMMEVNGKRFCVDCGMHQGNQEIDKRNRADEIYDPKNIDFVLLTHAHIDHSGLLPRIVKKGFKGDIFTTPPTRDLQEIMLLDSAHIQEMEAEWRNRKLRRRGKSLIEPLYTQGDAEKTLPLFKTIDYNKTFEPAPGVRVTYKDAGHILGSAFLEIRVKEEDSGEYRLVFSGDLGRPDQLLIKDPSEASPTDYLFVESTYGDRNHKGEDVSRQELADAIAYSHERGEKVIIPAFAVERTQEILYTLFLLRKQGKMPQDMPIFLDSPMAIRTTEVFRKHPEYMDKDTRFLLKNGEDPLALPNLKYTPKTEQSQAINTTPGPAIVISASGMCNAGRIQHHLRHNLWRQGASVVFVGYQGMGTPGRKIVDGAKSIRIHGENVWVNAKVYTIGGFSAHAGQSQILDWIDDFDRPNMEIFLVHGEHKGQKTLAKLIQERFNLKVHIPGYLETATIKPPEVLETVVDTERAQPRVDWEWVLGDTAGKLDQLRARLEELEKRPWVDQTDIRDRLLEVNSDLSSIISEM